MVGGHLIDSVLDSESELLGKLLRSLELLVDDVVDLSADSSSECWHIWILGFLFDVEDRLLNDFPELRNSGTASLDLHLVVEVEAQTDGHLPAAKT